MKILLTSLSFLFSILLSQAQLSAPALSPLSSTTQKLGLIDFSIEYSRPSVRGRKVFGSEGLVPYNEPWRTGANAVTKIAISDDLEIAGRPLPKGSYALLTTVQVDSWIVHLYPYERLPWDKFVEKSPSISIASDRELTEAHTETLYIGIENIQLDKADLVIAWENSSVAFPVHASAQEKMLKKIDRALAGPSNNEYYQAALYLHEANLNLESALQYIRQVTKSEKATFFQVYREAIILEELGRHEEAVLVARRGKKLAQEVGNKDFVRLNNLILMGS